MQRSCGLSQVRNERSWRLTFLPWHGSGKGSWTTFALHQLNWISQGNSQTFSHGDCKAIEMPLDPKTKLKKNVNKDDEMVEINTWPIQA
jgi:hypothetical protein